jgi:hypothetical protein
VITQIKDNSKSQIEVFEDDGEYSKRRIEKSLMIMQK